VEFTMNVVVIFALLAVFLSNPAVSFADNDPLDPGGAKKAWEER
jgi:hypothetical protein